MTGISSGRQRVSSMPSMVAVGARKCARGCWGLFGCCASDAPMRSVRRAGRADASASASRGALRAPRRAPEKLEGAKNPPASGLDARVAAAPTSAMRPVAANAARNRAFARERRPAGHPRPPRRDARRERTRRPRLPPEGGAHAQPSCSRVAGVPGAARGEGVKMCRRGEITSRAPPVVGSVHFRIHRPSTRSAVRGHRRFRRFFTTTRRWLRRNAPGRSGTTSQFSARRRSHRLPAQSSAGSACHA